jgi:hypothetical protein
LIELRFTSVMIMGKVLLVLNVQGQDGGLSWG